MKGTPASPVSSRPLGLGEPEIPAGHLLDGRFRIRETISRSGMASIYRADDEHRHGETVAIKVPYLAAESSSIWYNRFFNEEKIGAALNHKFLIKVHVPTREKCRPYLAMEFLRGRTLAETLKKGQPLPEGQALSLASKICEALEHLHAHGVVHRDLKPSNIMLCDDQSIRVFDFGLADAPQRSRSVLAKLTPVFGTPEYMSPEQIENAAVDERSDIYSLGLILYEMLTGTEPFPSEDPWESAFARTKGDPIAPRKINPAMSPQAEEIVLHALQRDPKKRYSTATALRTDLDQPSAVTVTGLCSRLSVSRWRFSFQGTPVLAGAVLGLGALASMVGLFLFLRCFVLK